MANNYLDFSEVLAGLSQEEEDWLHSQLATVYVFGDREYTEAQLPEDLDPREADWIGCRAYRDVPECAEYVKEMDMEGPGFECVFAADDDSPDGWQRHLWLHAGEWGYVDGAAQLMRKFLKRFRPDQCWSLSYATTCSKPRVGEFGGGAVFVTAEDVRVGDGYAFVETQRQAFERRKQQEIRLPCYGITIRLNRSDNPGSPGCGAITSELKVSGNSAADHRYNATIDGIESLLLAQACAGIDVESPACIEAVETAVEAIANHYGQ